MKDHSTLIAEWAMASEPARREDETPGHYALRIAARAVAMRAKEQAAPDDVRAAIEDALHRYQKGAISSREFLDEAVTAVTPDGWQPIETAPRDATEFLAAISVHHSNGKTWWERHILSVEGDEVGADYYQGWRIEDYSHWQPLPEPPARTALGEEG